MYRTRTCRARCSVYKEPEPANPQVPLIQAAALVLYMRVSRFRRRRAGRIEGSHGAQEGPNLPTGRKAPQMAYLRYGAPSVGQETFQQAVVRPWKQHRQASKATADL
jgi:hypothetical protein